MSEAGMPRAVRGMRDLPPSEVACWRKLEQILHEELGGYGYEELRLPLLEHAELFERSIGAVTDIVSKETYTFLDRGGARLTLRPEGTAGCLRAVLARQLLRGGPRRFWYLGPMFRHERPQKGRYRQFHQLGVEAYGWDGPDLDAELLLLCARLWRVLNIENVELQINSLGGESARRGYRAALHGYFEAHLERLNEEQRRCLRENPLRLLDSKAAVLRDLLREAPSILDYLEPEATAHFQGLQELLAATGLSWRVNPRLVRGLDYYGGTVFEWVASGLKASQDAFCAGGRYDGLSGALGGPPLPAAGFAVGLERLMALLPEASGTAWAASRPHVYLAHTERRAALCLAEWLRDQVPSLRLCTHCGTDRLRRQLRLADRSGAALALILGEQELAEEQVIWKSLIEDTPQEKCPRTLLPERLRRLVAQADVPGACQRSSGQEAH